MNKKNSSFEDLFVSPAEQNDEDQIKNQESESTTAPQKSGGRFKRKNTTKVFNNTYNSTDKDYDYLDLKKIQVDPKYERRDVIESYSYYEDNQLKISICDIWDLELQKIYSDVKKVHKKEFIFIYELYIKKLYGSYTSVEIFVALGEFLGLNLKSFYDALPPSYQQDLLNQLDIESSVFSNMKISKIF